MTAEEAFQQAYAYINKTALGGGALKGKNVTISSIDPIDGGNRITFSYTLDNDQVETRQLDVMDGRDGTDGISPVINEGANNTNDVYKLEIADIDKTFTTPNLKGRDGLSPTITPNLQNDEETYRLDILDANGILTTINLMGKPGQQGIPGQQGRQGEQGIQGIQGIQGEQGDPFLIYKEYGALEEFQASDFYAVGQIFGVKPSGEGKMYNVYRYAGEGEPPYTFVTSLGAVESIKGEPGKPGEQGVPGEKGEDGTTYTPQIGTVIEGDYAAASVDVDEGRKIVTFNFIIPKGKDGKDGEDGKTYKPVVGTVDTGDEVEVSIDLDEDKQEAKFNFIFPIFGGINKTVFTFQIDQSEPNPDSMITYFDDAKGMKPAYMDYALDRFNYGSWGDVWFIKDLKPCMLNYDGTVAYELNKDNYKYRLDGGLSDISNENFPGNAMSGVPKVYWKVVDNGDNTGKVSISNKRIDDDFNCWSHIDANWDEIDYCYIGIYDGSLVNGKLRSLSGRAPMVNQTRSAEVNYAKVNNIGGDNIWYTWVMCDLQLIRILLTLISKSTDSQTKFGSGNNNSYVNNNITGVKNSGTLNNKGLFWGDQDNTICMKAFGIENFFGNIWKSVAGWINDRGIQKIKMTWGKKDGSAINGYNFDGNGYVAIPGATPSGAVGGYITSVKFDQFGLIPYSSLPSGTASTYLCDGFWFSDIQNNYAFAGGATAHGLSDGAFCSFLANAASVVNIALGTSLSCKPLAKNGE